MMIKNIVWNQRDYPQILQRLECCGDVCIVVMCGVWECVKQCGGVRWCVNGFVVVCGWMCGDVWWCVDGCVVTCGGV